MSCAIILRVLGPTVLPEWAPKDPTEVLGLAWQVQTSIAAIAFAGLALIIQLAGTPPIAISSSREVLFRLTLFRGLLLYAGATNVALGVVATWIGGAAGVLICFIFCFVATVVFIGFSYFRVAAYFLNAEGARAAALTVLRDKIGGGLHELRLMSMANARLDEMFPTASPVARYAQTPVGAHETPLLELDDDKYLDDLDSAGLKSAAVEILRLVPPPGFKASMPHPGDSAPQEAAMNAVDPFLRIECGLGARVVAGDRLFTLVTAEPVSAALTKRAAALLRRCVDIRPAAGSGGSDAENAIKDELITLKDSMLVAAGTGVTGALAKGLDAHEALFSALLSAAGNRDLDVGLRFRSYGPHWQWLQINIREITEVAIRTLGSRGLTLAADHSYSLCRTALKAGDLSALRDFLWLYPTHVRCAIEARDPLPLDYVAVSMQNLTSLYFRAVSSDDAELGEVLREFAAETFGESLKACIDARDPKAFDKLLPYFETSRTFFTTSAERRAASDGKATVLLALLAWTFLSAKRSDSDASRLVHFAETLADLVPGHLIWQAYADAVGCRRPSWQNWEIAIKEPLTFHVMTFDGHLAAAALVMAERKGMTLPQSPVGEDHEQATMLLGAVPLAEESLRHFPSLARPGLSAVTERLTRLVETGKAAQRDEILRKPLEQVRIQKFVEAVPRSLQENPFRLADLLPHVTGAPMQEEPRNYSINTLVPRQYFVTLPGHMFEPAELATDVANGMAAGENRFILESLLAGRVSKAADEDQVRQVLQGFADHKPLVLILNSWQAALALDVADPVTGTTSASPKYSGLSLTTDDLGLEQVPPTCIVCDTALLPLLVRDPFPLDNEGTWHMLEAAGIAVSIRDYAEHTQEPTAQLMAGVSLGWAAEMPSEAVQVFHLSSAVS
ncbi:hypothetical protein ACQP2E_28065 [Actinoplanes sp. CA-015351]|uniref:hypothetical protein n=1 Tax=Actinoplanes sp. CA-015351 TaxID=3239897 RepID=UPI003D983F09